MQTCSPILTRLNVETRAQHPAADAAWLELMSLDVTRPRYLGQLIATYGFEAPVEAALTLTPHISTLVQLRDRARAGFIVQDLLTLGLTPSRIARLPQCTQIVPFRDQAEALGWMYVLERATLLHDAIRRHLQARLPNVHSLNYLSAYDGIASTRWKEFGLALDHVSGEQGMSRQIIAAAHDAFECQRMWFSHNEPMVATV